ncbi:multidrug effflux MFS transporter [Herbaspirillum robiniae]|uniref:Bcr/CflA family efflux transporter n=1 Tax=Herbaspirillum robiniae TaxID=2014887 RepID=A0A246WM18_9BURK|nr:multidrug effflux MFS transporter [Herbaspirillum robiniae]OWY27387.1 Bcr/CflA family drug resistance efflux transporter [Herbaspirillum robiniae]
MKRLVIPVTSPLFVVMLGVLAALPPLAIDIGLPAIPNLQAGFGISIGEATQTLTVFLLGFSIGPVLFGPLSDRYGRKPVLLFGVGLFSLAAFACALASTIGQLLAVRFAQGIAAGAAAALPAAIVRDVFSGREALSRQSYVALVMGVAPLVAPLMGAALLQAGDWKLIYESLGLLGTALFFLAFFGYVETKDLTAKANQSGNVLKVAAAAYASLFRNRHYLLNAGLLATTFGTMFAYITGSSAVFIDMLGLPGTTYGAIFAVTAAGTICGAASNGRLVKVLGEDKLLRSGVCGSFAVNMLLLACALFGARSPVLITACVFGSNFFSGIVMPNATHQALHSVGHIAGSASALQRSLQFLSGAGAGALVGLIAGNQLMGMAIVMALFASVGVVLLLMRSGRQLAH